MPENVGDKLVRRQSWLDLVGNAFGAVVAAFYRIPGTRPVKDVLHGTWPLRHPLHPAVTDVVVGGLTVVAALDVAWLVTADAGLWRATDIALLVSLLFAGVSVLSGLTDWNETYGNERRLGILHGALMALISLGYLASLLMRLGGGAREPAAYISIGLWVVLAVVAHLGGEMSFGFGTGVNRLAWAEAPGKWRRTGVAAATLEDRKPVRAEVDGFAVMVAKLDGQLRAMGAVCTHAGGPLDEGDLVGDRRDQVKCPWHGSVFSLRTGAAVHGPATMDEPVFETRVAEDGSVEVRKR